MHMSHFCKDSVLTCEQRIWSVVEMPLASELAIKLQCPCPVSAWKNSDLVKNCIKFYDSLRYKVFTSDAFMRILFCFEIEYHHEFFFFSSQFNVFSVHEAVLYLASPFTATTQAWSLRKWVNVPFRLVQCSKGLQITFSAILEQITPFLMRETTFWRKLKVPCGCEFVSYYLLSAIDIGLKEKYMSSDRLSVPLLFINHHKL